MILIRYVSASISYEVVRSEYGLILVFGDWIAVLVHVTSRFNGINRAILFRFSVLLKLLLVVSDLTQLA